MSTYTYNSDLWFHHTRTILHGKSRCCAQLPNVLFWYEITAYQLQDAKCVEQRHTSKHRLYPILFIKQRCAARVHSHAHVVKWTVLCHEACQAQVGLSNGNWQWWYGNKLHALADMEFLNLLMGGDDCIIVISVRVAGTFTTYNLHAWRLLLKWFKHIVCNLA